MLEEAEEAKRLFAALRFFLFSPFSSAIWRLSLRPIPLLNGLSILITQFISVYVCPMCSIALALHTWTAVGTAEQLVAH